MNVNFATDCIYLQLWMCGLRRCGHVSVLTGYVSANGHKIRHQSEGIVPCGDGMLDVKEFGLIFEKRKGLITNPATRLFGTVAGSGIDVKGKFGKL